MISPKAAANSDNCVTWKRPNVPLPGNITAQQLGGRSGAGNAARGLHIPQNPPESRDREPEMTTIGSVAEPESC